MINIQNPKARLATISQLRGILENHLDPVPPDATLRIWFDQANVPRLKANPLAKRGGGPCYYSVSGVEKFLQSRTVLCRR